MGKIALVCQRRMCVIVWGSGGETYSLNTGLTSDGLWSSEMKTGKSICLVFIAILIHVPVPFDV